MNFDRTPEFNKDLKRLSKKWRSLPNDLRDAELTITDVYTDSELQETFVQKFFDGKRATKIVVTESCEVVKMRLDVQSLGNSQKVRVVFVAVKTENEIIFVELYAKNDKEREDPKRYSWYLQ